MKPVPAPPCAVVVTDMLMRVPAPAPRPLRILCDVDGVLFDFVDLCQQVAPHLEREALERDWDHFGGADFPEGWQRLPEHVMFRQLGLVGKLLPGARKFWRALNALPGARVRVCTSPLPNCPEWMGQRAAWLQSTLGIPAHEQFHIHEKAALAGGPRGYDVLIDDKVENCVEFVEAGGRAWCIAQPYNQDVKCLRGDYAACLAWLDRGAP